VVGLWSLRGVGEIVHNAEGVIDGNKLKAEMVQREVDHLQWASRVSELINDEQIHTLDVQTDPHKCGFGQWYYGEGRRQAELLVPQVATALAGIEEPHRRLHESATRIDEAYCSANPTAGSILRDAKTSHLAWTHQIKDAFLNRDLAPLENLQLDPTKCGFGTWFYGEAMAIRAEDAEYDRILASAEQHHTDLHQSAEGIRAAAMADDWPRAQAIFFERSEPAAQAVLDHLSQLLVHQDAEMAGLAEAAGIYTHETVPAMTEVRDVADRLERIVPDAAPHRRPQASWPLSMSSSSQRGR